MPLQYAKLFPNPIDDYLYFDYLLSKRLLATAYLYDMQGRLIRERRLKKGNVSQVWNLHDLASGIYYFVVRSEGSVFFREKIVKI